MNPNVRLMIAGVLLTVALLFYFCGEALVDFPDEEQPASPTPTSMASGLDASPA